LLASDYVRTNTDLATMEAANEAARRAVNGILSASGSTQPKCAVWPLKDLPPLAAARAADKGFFDRGLSNPLDVSFDQVIRDAAKGRVQQLGGTASAFAPIVQHMWHLFMRETLSREQEPR
jgi:hypothetical protein